jgi:hypothetical protein
MLIFNLTMYHLLFFFLSIATLIGMGKGKALSHAYLVEARYLMRLHPEGHRLVRSQNPQLTPWLPNRQFGWLLTDRETLLDFFEPVSDTGRFPVINFDKQFVLAFIRHDVYPWDMQIQAMSWSRRDMQIQIHYQLIPAGKKRKAPILSVQLVVVDKNRQLQRLGIENVCFKLKEDILNGDPDIPNYGLDEGEIIFPPAYTLEELLYPSQGILADSTDRQ